MMVVEVLKEKIVCVTVAGEREVRAQKPPC